MVLYFICIFLPKLTNTAQTIVFRDRRMPTMTIHLIMIMILFQSMESLNRNHVKEKDSLNGQLIKLKDELRKAKSERNEMEQTAHDCEKVCLVKRTFVINRIIFFSHM